MCKRIYKVVIVDENVNRLRQVELKLKNKYITTAISEIETAKQYIEKYEHDIVIASRSIQHLIKANFYYN